MTNHFVRWTPEEDEKLIRLYGTKKLTSLTREFHRTIHALSWRARKLGLVKPANPKPRFSALGESPRPYMLLKAEPLHTFRTIEEMNKHLEAHPELADEYTPVKELKITRLVGVSE